MDLMHPGDATVSADVCALIPTTPAVAKPIVNPLIVTTNASEVPMIAPDVVRTTAVSFVAEHAMLKPSTFVAPALTTGVSNGMKKLGGNMSTMVLFGRMSRAGAKDKYTETLVFPAMR